MSSRGDDSSMDYAEYSETEGRVPTLHQSNPASATTLSRDSGLILSDGVFDDSAPESENCSPPSSAIYSRSISHMEEIAKPLAEPIPDINLSSSYGNIEGISRRIPAPSKPPRRSTRRESEPYGGHVLNSGMSNRGLTRAHAFRNDNIHQVIHRQATAHVKYNPHAAMHRSTESLSSIGTNIDSSDSMEPIERSRQQRMNHHMDMDMVLRRSESGMHLNVNGELFPTIRSEEILFGGGNEGRMKNDHRTNSVDIDVTRSKSRGSNSTQVLQEKVSTKAPVSSNDVHVNLVVKPGKTINAAMDQSFYQRHDTDNKIGVGSPPPDVVLRHALDPSSRRMSRGMTHAGSDVFPANITSMRHSLHEDDLRKLADAAEREELAQQRPVSMIVPDHVTPAEMLQQTRMKVQQPVGIKRSAHVPMKSTANVPRKSTVNVPVKSSANVPVKSSANVPMKASANVPVKVPANVPIPAQSEALAQTRQPVPPSHQEATHRNSLLPSGIPLYYVSEADITQQTVNSAKARELYEKSISQYTGNDSSTEQHTPQSNRKYENVHKNDKLEECLQNEPPASDEIVYRHDRTNRSNPYDRTPVKGTVADQGGETRRSSTNHHRDNHHYQHKRHARLIDRRAHRNSDTKLQDKAQKNKNNVNLSRSKSDSSEHLHKIKFKDMKSMENTAISQTIKSRPKSEIISPGKGLPDCGWTSKKGIASMRNKDWHKDLAEKYSQVFYEPTKPTVETHYAYVKPTAQQNTSNDEPKSARRWKPPVHPSKDLVVVSQNKVPRDESMRSKTTNNKRYMSQTQQRQHNDNRNVMPHNAQHVLKTTSKPDESPAKPTPKHTPVEYVQPIQQAAYVEAVPVKQSTHIQAVSSASVDEASSPAEEEEPAINWSVSELRSIYDKSANKRSSAHSKRRSLPPNPGSEGSYV